MTDSQDARCRIEGAAGLITLDRPKALNALTLDAVRAMRAALDAWEHDPAVTRIVIEGAGEKAFCAGGDIRRLVEAGKAGRREEAQTFWREEYELNALIARYPKPYVALIEGIVMGGGVGVALHGSHRVVGERALFAMPEVGIGFFPDVGASHALPRLPGKTGLYLALTGARLGPADQLAMGLATHAVGASAMPEIREGLIAGEDVDALLSRHRHDPGPAPIETIAATIDACFGESSVEEIVAALTRMAGEGDAPAETILAQIRGKSPTSQKIAFEQMHRGAGLSFEEAMRMEYRIVSRILDGEDFYEGVRAVLIDKDHAPRWKPDRLEDVTPAMIEAYFAPLGEHELAV
ncbi:enoyl-CoA hydratase/isomerase family protein [Salinarimonas ramus]|uniref:3-hydroxyisobutyryl-CoA hydrolase n=1 Tax=Salinarimonas ramus TaxID=690164 RepID=A0A917V530_9HYPH|nr:enoyl-CoA hydratase/isomerase family protein [Salinarimonas ramus]GGK37928.1 enoyl-CoA hydratase [Salinarimonas ramus]